MICVGAFCLAGFGGRHPTALSYVVAGLLFVGGAALFLGQKLAVYPAFSGALAMLVTGALSLYGHPQWALPVPAWISIGLGALLFLRVLLARLSIAERDRSRPTE